MPDRLPGVDRARALVWWPRPQLVEVCWHVAQAWSEWAHDWLRVKADAKEADCVPAHEGPVRTSQVWAALGVRGPAAAWVEVRSDPLVDTMETIFGTDHGARAVPSAQPGIAQAVAARAWTELGNSLRKPLQLDVDLYQCEPDATLFKPWSGAVQLLLPSPGQRSCSVLLNASCVQALLDSRGVAPAAAALNLEKPSANLIPLGQALADRKLPVRVALAPCELDLGSLEGLRIGDIVPLPHSLDSPLLVSTLDVAVCAGFLGKQAGFKAVELVRESASSVREPQFDQHL